LQEIKEHPQGKQGMHFRWEVYRTTNKQAEQAAKEHLAQISDEDVVVHDFNEDPFDWVDVVEEKNMYPKEIAGLPNWQLFLLDVFY